MKAVVHGSSSQDTPNTNEQIVGMLCTCNACKDTMTLHSLFRIPLDKMYKCHKAKLQVSKVSRYITCLHIMDEGLHICVGSMLLSITVYAYHAAYKVQTLRQTAENPTCSVMHLKPPTSSIFLATTSFSAHQVHSSTSVMG